MSVHGNIEYLSWDSEFFQKKIGKVSFQTSAPVIDKADFAPYSLIQAKIPANRLDLIDGLNDLGFLLVEGEVDLCLDIGTENAFKKGTKQALSGNSDPVLSIATADDIAELRQLAETVFQLSRFRSPWFESVESGRFYALWAEKAVLGTFDHQCFILRDRDQKLLGFVTLRDLGHHEARIGLLAVAAEGQGKGIGRQLMEAARQWCVQHSVARLHVATQISNVAAMRLYISSGASISSSSYWLYR